MGGLSKARWCLLGCLIVVLVLAASSVFVPNKLVTGITWVADSDSAYNLRTLTQQEAVREDTSVEMVVDSIGLSQIGFEPVVILKEKDGEVYLPIWIGLVEANAISVVLEGIEQPRPLTPDLLCSIIDRMRASVEYIIINDLKGEVFYASIIVNANLTQMEIDSRPSDAIAIALRVKAPIYVERAVLDKAGIQPEHEVDESTAL